MEILNLIAAVSSVISMVVLILILLKTGAAQSKQIEGTGMTAKELADELGGSIESAFQNYVPQPEKLGAAVSSSVEQAAKKALESVDSVHKNMLTTQGQLAEKWSGQEKNTVAALEAASKAVAEASGKLGPSLAAAVEKIQAALTAHAAQLEKSDAASREQLKGILAAHADSLNKAGQGIASQLEKIMQLEKDIQQVLHVQQVTEGTLKSVAATDEFKQTLASLRKHIEQSDSLLREVAKPRTIRLVEQES